MLDTFFRNKNFLCDFNNCLYGYKTIEEFESNWDLILENYKLRENKWLAKMYKI